MSSNPPAENEQTRLQRELRVINELGIHARPAALIVKTSSRFKADIYLEKEGAQVSAKSIMGVLTLVSACGTRLKVSAEGPDAEQALDALEELFSAKFHED